MKKILILLLVLALGITSLVACGKNKNENKDEPNNDNNPSTDNGTEGDEPEAEVPGVDFLNEDLSEYIEIAEQYYKGFEVLVDPGRISTLDVENVIIQTLCKYKNKTAIPEGEGDGVITVGDVAHIYYKGYYMKDGVPCFFEGGDNTESGSSYPLEIGSGGFIPGFEYNLIGKNPKDHTAENPIVVETYFPEKYQSAELAGKTAYFIVTVDKLVEYDAPELDDVFVTETLKMTAEDLAEYDGETLADKYRAYVREQVLTQNGLDVDSLIMDAFWKSVTENAVVKKYPEKQVKETYDSFVDELEYYYNYYSSYYDYETFMCLYLGLDVGSDWKAYVNDLAKEQIKEKLIFYHIMNVEGLKPTEEEYNILFDEYFEEALRNNGITPDKYQTESGYLTAKEDYKNQLISKHGEDYFKSMIYYDETVKGIKSFANIIEIAE